MAESKEHRDEIRVLDENHAFLKRFLDQLKTRPNSEDEEVEAVVRAINVTLKDYVYNLEGVKPKGRARDSEDIKSEEDEDDGDSISLANEVLEECVNGRDDDRGSTLEILMKKFDTRKVLPLEVFDESCGMKLENYFKKFEEYYEANYKCSKSFWTEEFMKYLKGRNLEGFQSIKQIDDEYEAVKRKFINWYQEEDAVRKDNAKKVFSRATYKTGETLLMYCNRLLTLFKKAYPRKDVDCSNTLINQLRQSVPMEVKQILNAQILSAKIEDKKMTWNKVLKIARIYDLDNLEKGEERAIEDEIIEINLTNAKHLQVDSGRTHYRSGGNYSNPPRKYDYENYQLSSQYYNRYQPQTRERKDEYARVPTTKTCSFCKRFGHIYEECRVRLGLCLWCGERGHIAKECRGQQRSSPKMTLNGRNQSISPKKRMEDIRRSRSYSQQGRRRVFENKDKKDINLN